MRSAKLGNHLKSILLPELLRILFWTCIGALAVSLLALIIAGVYFRHKLVHGSQKHKFYFYNLLYMCGWVFVLIYSLPKKLLKILCTYINISVTKVNYFLLV